MNAQDYLKIAKVYNKIEDDKGRLAFLKEHRGIMKVVLDNDHTSVEFVKQKDMSDEDFEMILENDIYLNSFDNYHYWSQGNLILFDFAGIDAEFC